MNWRLSGKPTSLWFPSSTLGTRQASCRRLMSRGSQAGAWEPGQDHASPKSVMVRLFQRTARVAWAPTLAVAMIFAATAPAAAQSVWELTPYRIRIVIAAGDSPELTPRLMTDLGADLVSRADGLIGAAWDVSVDDAGPALARAMLDAPDAVTLESIPEDLLEFDKVMLLAIVPRQSEYQVVGRELDVRTRTFNTSIELLASQTRALGRTTFTAVLRAFAPLAQIVPPEGGEEEEIALRLRASGFPARDAAYSPVVPGSLFRPIIRYDDRQGKPKRIMIMPWTFLRVEDVPGTGLKCKVHSGIRNPLGGRRRGRVSQLALAVINPDKPTRLVLKSRTDPDRVLVGYDVHCQAPGSKSTELVGRTDRRGSVTVEPSDSVLRTLYVKHGGALLARLPMVPGISDQLEVPVADDDLRLEAEGFITGVQQELVDIVSRRAMLVARAKSRLKAGKLDEADSLIRELHVLGNRAKLAALLDQEKRRTFSKDAAMQRKIELMFDDTRKLLFEYVDPKQAEELAGQLRKAREAAG